MQKSLPDFVRDRRAEIETQMQAFQEELAQLDSVESMLSGKRVVIKEARNAPTIKEQILSVLADEVDGVRSNEILDVIKKKYGTNLLRESLSPQLSRLKDEGKITLTGRKWFLAKINPPSDTTLAGLSAADNNVHATLPVISTFNQTNE